MVYVVVGDIFCVVLHARQECCLQKFSFILTGYILYYYMCAFILLLLCLCHNGCAHPSIMFTFNMFIILLCLFGICNNNTIIQNIK